jgi:O-antigen/teichoic acid export membrane protein
LVLQGVIKKTLTSPRFQRLAKEGSWIVAGQIVAVLGALALVRALTEYLEPAQYGQLALGLTVAGLVNQVVMGGVTNGIGRFYSIAAEKNDLSGYLHASRRLMGLATAVVMAIALVLMAGLLWLDSSQWMGLAAAALVLSVSSGYNSSLSGIQNAARQRAIGAFHGGLDAWLKILLAVGVMHWLGSTSTAVVLGYALSSLLVTGSQFIFLRRLIRPQGEKPLASANWGGQIWTYSWPFSTWGVFTWAQQVSDRWALQTFASTQEVGMYAVVFQLGYVPIGLATGMATSFLGPILYQRSGNVADHTRNISVHRIAWRITVACLLVTALAFFFTFLMHELIFHLLVAAKYHAVSYLLPWMVLAGGVFAAGQMLALKLMSEMKPAAMTVAKIVTAILGVGLNIYGASQFGLQGVVAALVAFSGIYFFWIAWLAQHPPASIIIRHHEKNDQT